MIVIKLVRLVPESQFVLAVVVDGRSDPQKVLKELRRDIFVYIIVLRQFEGDAQQVQAIHGHPARAVRLADEPARGQRLAAVETANVVQPKESALEYASPLLILAVHPPCEIQQQFLKDPLQKH